MEPAEEDVIELVHQPDVVHDLEPLKPLLDGRQHVDESPLLRFVEVVRVRYGEVVVEMVVHAPFVTPGVEAVDQRRDPGVFAAHGD